MGESQDRTGWVFPQAPLEGCRKFRWTHLVSYHQPSAAAWLDRCRVHLLLEGASSMQHHTAQALVAGQQGLHCAGTGTAACSSVWRGICGIGLLTNIYRQACRACAPLCVLVNGWWVLCGGTCPVWVLQTLHLSISAISTVSVRGRPLPWPACDWYLFGACCAVPLFASPWKSQCFCFGAAYGMHAGGSGMCGSHKVQTVVGLASHQPLRLHHAAASCWCCPSCHKVCYLAANGCIGHC